MGKTRAVNLNWSRLCLVPLGLLALVGSAVAQSDGPDVSPSIIRVLTRRLNPSNLSLPTAKLRTKLNAIGEEGNLFQVAEDRTDAEPPDVPMHGLSKVSGSSREVMAVLEPTKSSESPRLTYWIGVIDGRVAARAIPPNSDSMIGPIYGAWRRRGNYLVGVGYDAVYHSLTWIDAEIYVLRETDNGPRILQRFHIDGMGRPFGFVNASSLTIDCLQVSKVDYETIRAGRRTVPTCENTWEFRKGKYVLVRTARTNNELWAVDRLMTAVAKNRQGVLKAMIPNGPNRRVFLKRLRSAINHGVTAIDQSGEATLVSEQDSSYRITLEMKDTKSGWVLRDVEVEQ